jgi:TetR/AcrR family transcriptional repressor of nem operon
MKPSNRKLQKEKTEQELLKVAAAMFKKNGLKQTSIDEVMAGANLTRGSFYAYFTSKTDLAIKALKWSIVKSHEMVRKHVKGFSSSDQDELLVFFNHYLSPKHRDNIQAGCPVAALSRDFAKETIATRKIFAEILNETIEERRKLLKINNKTLTRDEWMGVILPLLSVAS